MIKNMINFLIKKLAIWCQSKGRVYYITGESTEEDVYLVRYIVLKTKWCCVYIHRFMRSDSSDPHDHPWNFISYVVEGGYEEYFYDINKPVKIKMKNKWVYKYFWTLRKNKRAAGSIAYRKSTDIHRVVINRTYKKHEVEKAPLTACIMFKRHRHWGFWPLPDGGSKFVDWRKYLKISPYDPRVEGSE